MLKPTNQTISVFIKLKDNTWLQHQRIAGRVVANALSTLESLVKDKTTKSLIELNAIAEELILEQKCIPTFKNYKGFPAGVCISINKQLVHGIPTDYKLKDGDVVSFDLGATFEGAIADAAITCIYGQPKYESHIKLIAAAKEALTESIKKAVVGNCLGEIGNTIYNIGRGNGFSVVTNYGGHGLCYNKPHAAPFVSNRAEATEGIIMQPGLTLAIEPLFVLGSSNKTKTASDGWTVSTDDISAHFEHTIFLHEDRTEIITERNC